VIYLIGEIVLYLLAALLLGTGAGWLLRDWRAGQAVGAASEVPGVPGAFAAGPPFTDSLVGSRAGSPAESRVRDLEAELLGARACAAEFQASTAARMGEIEALTRRLTGAERRMLELERERALQNRALQVLHQQLELAVERRTPQSSRATGTAG